MVCGKVVAASVDEDCVDDKGYIVWERARPVHYCGAPYGNGAMFVPAFVPSAVAIRYEGPESNQFQSDRRAMFEDM